MLALSAFSGNKSGAVKMAYPQNLLVVPLGSVDPLSLRKLVHFLTLFNACVEGLGLG
jgi:hypothetical protein